MSTFPGNGGQGKRVPGACCADQNVPPLGTDSAGTGGTDSIACNITCKSDAELQFTFTVDWACEMFVVNATARTKTGNRTT